VPQRLSVFVATIPPGYDVLFKNIALTKVVPEVKKGDIVLDGI